MDTSPVKVPDPLKTARVDQRSKTVLQIPRVRRFLNLMIEGKALKEAAIEAGLRVRRARQMMKDPAIRKAFFSELEDLRTSERARNILLAVTVRDAGMESGAGAAHKKVALDAARYLDGDEGQGKGGITINNVLNVATPGLVVDLGSYAAPSPVISDRVADRAKPLIEHGSVTDDDR